MTKQLYAYAWGTIVLVLCSCGVTFAYTSIAILKDDTHIVIAADSKKYRSPSSMCKINRLGNIYWAASGLVGDSETGYDVRPTAELSIRKGENVAAALAYFMKTIPPIASTEINYVRRKHPDWYADLFREPGMAMIEIAFFAIENGKPVVAFVTYEKKDNTDGTVSLLVGENGIYGQCPNKAHACGRLLGVKNKGREYLRSHSWEGDLAGAAEAVVRLEIEEDPRSVGPPVAVMGLDESGPYWINHGTCNDGPDKRKRHPPSRQPNRPASKREQ